MKRLPNFIIHRGTNALSSNAKHFYSIPLPLLHLSNHTAQPAPHTAGWPAQLLKQVGCGDIVCIIEKWLKMPMMIFFKKLYRKIIDKTYSIFSVNMLRGVNIPINTQFTHTKFKNGMSLQENRKVVIAIKIFFLFLLIFIKKQYLSYIHCFTLWNSVTTDI